MYLRVYVFEGQHVAEALLALRVKPTIDLGLGRRVKEGAKGHVDHWKVRVVEGVTPSLVVYAVSFRALNEIAQPVGRANV